LAGECAETPAQKLKEGPFMRLLRLLALVCLAFLSVAGTRALSQSAQSQKPLPRINGNPAVIPAPTTTFTVTVN
jgi:cytochrome c-type biogenesis protein CcmH/NrfG